MRFRILYTINESALNKNQGVREGFSIKRLVRNDTKCHIIPQYGMHVGKISKVTKMLLPMLPMLYNNASSNAEGASLIHLKLTRLESHAMTHL